MAVIQKSLRIPEEVVREIERISAETRNDFSSVANELLRESVRIHRCPGIVFTEGVRGRRARIAGTGIEVWEVVSTYQSVGKNIKRLCRAYHWMTDQQIQSALGYYKTYPEEVTRLITENEGWTRERLHRRHPFLPPNPS
jgi:uncharacterized protein (DUF433 family)